MSRAPMRRSPAWSDYTAQQGLLNPGGYPIIQGIDQAAQQLPAAPTNGHPVPAVLTQTAITLGDQA